MVLEALLQTGPGLFQTVTLSVPGRLAVERIRLILRPQGEILELIHVPHEHTRTIGHKRGPGS
jgi:hypothetical protein